MEAIADFEDLLALLEKYRARYLIVGGLAFIYHAKPRFTKDMDLWVDPDAANIEKANAALREFPSPELLTVGAANEILQLGVAPNRIDILVSLGGVGFGDAWQTRVRDTYGSVEANWIGFDTLLQIKAAIDHPRHQEDARVLRAIKAGRKPELDGDS